MPEVGEIKQVYYKESRRHIWVRCPVCQQERWAQERSYIAGGKTGLCLDCFNKSDKARQAGDKGRHNRKLKSGHNNNKERSYIYKKIGKDDFFYPMATKEGKVAEHRLVMAKHLNRCLLPWEVVHHKNGNRKDNKLENLQLLPTSIHHLVDNETKAYIRKLESELAQLKGKLPATRKGESE